MSILKTKNVDLIIVPVLKFSAVENHDLFFFGIFVLIKTKESYFYGFYLCVNIVSLDYGKSKSFLKCTQNFNSSLRNILNTSPILNYSVHNFNLRRLTQEVVCIGGFQA